MFFFVCFSVFLQVLSIEELGYRKRLLYGINELKAGHPEWCTNSVDTALQVRLTGESSHLFGMHVMSTVNCMCSWEIL